MKFKIGDKVRVCKPEGIRYGHAVDSTVDDDVFNTWEEEMDDFDGDVFEISSAGFGGYGGGESTDYFQCIPEWLELVEEN